MGYVTWFVTRFPVFQRFFTGRNNFSENKSFTAFSISIILHLHFIFNFHHTKGQRVQIEIFSYKGKVSAAFNRGAADENSTVTINIVPEVDNFWNRNETENEFELAKREKRVGILYLHRYIYAANFLSKESEAGIDLREANGGKTSSHLYPIFPNRWICKSVFRPIAHTLAQRSYQQ